MVGNQAASTRSSKKQQQQEPFALRSTHSSKSPSGVRTYAHNPYATVVTSTSRNDECSRPCPQTRVRSYLLQDESLLLTSSSLSPSHGLDSCLPHQLPSFHEKQSQRRSAPTTHSSGHRSPSPSQTDSDESPFEHSNCNVKVKDLPRDFTNTELQKVFETYFGSVATSIVITDRQGRSRGYGFVLMQREKDAAYAIRQMNDLGLRIRGCIITAHLSKKRDYLPLEGMSVSNNNHGDGVPPGDCRRPLPPALEEGLSWSDEVEQDDAVSSLVNRVRELSRMKLPLKDRNVKKYFHRFLDSPDTPQHIKDDFNTLTYHHQMSVYRALCSEPMRD